MPGGDRTGPLGQGPMTGRGAGFCAGYAGAGYSNPGYGAGRAFLGTRGGRGWRNRFFATGVPGWRFFAGRTAPVGTAFSEFSGTPREELDTLKEQARYLENSLKELQTRMEDLASRNKSE